MPTYWPTDVRLANLKHWIEPALIEVNANQLLPNNTAVGAYRDMMETTDYAQATAGFKPLYKTNQRFGRGCLHFDGADDYLEAGDTNLVVGANACTMICAFAPDDHTAPQNVWGELSGKCTIQITGGNVRAQVTSSATASAVRALPATTGLWHVAALRYGGAVGVECMLDDPDNSAINGSISGNFAALGAIRISDASAGDEYDGRFGAGAIWDVRLTGDDFYRAFLYFLTRWRNRGDALEISRERASRFLQLRSRPRMFVEIATGLRSLDAAPGADVGVSHPRGPHPAASGWRRSERRPTRKLSSNFNPGTMTAALRLADALDIAHTLRETGSVRRSADAKREGVAISGVGASREYHRIGYAYVRDPGDMRVVKVPPGIVKIERTPIHWAADPERLVSGILSEHYARNEVLRSSFVNGLTGITQTPGTGGAIALDATLPVLFDASVGAQVVKLTSGTTDCWIGWPATGSLLANTHVCVSVDYRCDTGDAPSLQIVRGVDGFFWNDSTQAFQAGNVWNALAIGDPLEILRGRTKDINVGSNATTLTLRFGFPGTTAGRIAHVYHGQPETPGGFPTSRIVTTTAVDDRELELLALPNPSSRRVWPNGEGTLALKYTPLYSRQDLVDAGGSAVFLPHLLQVHHSVFGTSSGHGWTLEYEPSAGASGQLQFFGSNAGQGSGPPRATFDVALVAGQTYRIVCRWFAGVVSIFVDGAQGTDATINGAPTETDDSMLYIGGRNNADGYIEDIELKPRAMHAEWCKAWRT